MIDDKLFGTLVALVGGGIFLHTALSKYGYDKAIHVLKVYSLFLFSIGVVVACVIVGIKMYPKKEEPKIAEQPKPKRKIPEIKIELDKIAKQREPEEEPDERPTIVRPRVRVTVSNDVKCYKLKGLKKHDISYLKRYRYKTRVYLNPFSKKKEIFIFKTNESERHFLMIQAIVDFLKDKVDKVRTFETVKPDITFEINKKKFAIEVETGKTMKHARKQLQNKVNLLNKNYDSWFFVVTDKNFARKYKAYGKVVDKRGVANYLKKLLKSVR